MSLTLSSLLPLLSLASAGHSDGPVSWPTWGEAAFYLIGITFFLLLNAFFVASEFSVVKVRPSQLENASKARGVKTAKQVVNSLDGYLSACQLGITIASLALGFLGEPFVEKLIGPPLHAYTDLSSETIGKISWGVAMLSFTFLHVVIGELLPKSIAIRKSLGTTLAVAKPLHLFYASLKWAIVVLNGTANWLLKTLFKIDPVSEGEAHHSAEELALLVEESERRQEVTETEREILINALELNDVSVKDVMTPRSEVVFLDLEESFDSNLQRAIEAKHTRFPLVRGHLDDTLGLIHIKDVVGLMLKDDQDLRQIRRPLAEVAETMRLDDLLKFFLDARIHLALVVDEFGDPAGLVFMDNIMAELVGEIQDEFDEEPETDFTPLAEGEFVVDGALSLIDLSDHVDDLELESGEVTTLGGYVTQQLGHLPEPGESVQIQHYLATVTRTDGRRIEEIHFLRQEPEEEPTPNDTSEPQPSEEPKQPQDTSPA